MIDGVRSAGAVLEQEIPMLGSNSLRFVLFCTGFCIDSFS